MKKIIHLRNVSNSFLLLSSVLILLLATTFLLGTASDEMGHLTLRYHFGELCLILLVITLVGYYITFRFNTRSERLMKQRYHTDNLVDCYKKFEKEIADLN